MLRCPFNAPLAGAHRPNGLLNPSFQRFSVGSSLARSQNVSTMSARLQLDSISRSFQCQRYVHSSLILKDNKDISQEENTFWQWYRPKSELIEPLLQMPDKMPYEKGKYVTDQITKPEAERYLYPLYLRGWDVKTMRPGDGFNKLQGDMFPFLVGRFVLKSSLEVGGLLASLVSLQEQEKHHVSFTVWPGRRPLITVQSQTHSARKELDYVPESIDPALTEPGITLRDIRIAVALEEIVRESGALFMPKSGVEHDTDKVSQFITARKTNWKNLMSRHPWKEQQ